MCSTRLLTQVNLSGLRKVVSVGFKNAAEALTIMVDRHIEVGSPGLSLTPIEKVPGLVGQGDEIVVSVYLGVTGAVTGHMLLIFSPEAAGDMAAMLLGTADEGPASLDDMGRSALGELGNITGSCLLCALSDATSLDIRPSPPYLVVDMAGAAMDGALASLAMTMNEVLTIDTRFIDDERQIGCLFIMLPELVSLDLLLEKLAP